jgi:outer membrane protein
MKLPYITTMFSAFLVLAVQISAQAQNDQPTTTILSLKQAQEYAIKNNANSRNSDLDMQIAKKKVWETTAIGLPQINASGSYQHLFTVPELSLGATSYLTTTLPNGTPVLAEDIGKNVTIGYTPLPPIKLGVQDNTTFNFTVSQLIFSGEYIVGLQATKVFYEMTAQSKEKTEIDLKESVANSYALALVLTESKNVLAQSLENTNKTLSDMQAMFKQGMIENTDVDQIQLVSLTLINALSSMNRQLDATYDLIKYQIGMPFTENIILSDSLEGIAGTVNLESVINTQFNLNNNLDYQILTTSEAISALNLKREKSTYLPTLNAVYQHTTLLNQPEFNFTPKDVFMVSVNVPIFSSGMRNVKVQQRKMELQKSTNTKNDIANGLQLQYINTRNELTTAYENYLNNKKNIELTKRVYDKSVIKFSEGLATSQEITINLNQYLTAQTNLYNSIFSIFSAKNKLDKLNNNL